MRVWLDDKREMPQGFDIHVKTEKEAIDLLKTGRVSKISLDHDLGDEYCCGNGYKVAMFIEHCAYNGSIPRLEWNVHSANPVGKKRMEIALQNADRMWEN